MAAEEKTGRRGEWETGRRGDGESVLPPVAPSPTLPVSHSPRLINQACAAVLLAAGMSRRMGAFKPLLPFGGGSVVGACVESLRAAGAREGVVVVGQRAGGGRAAPARETCVRFAF